MSDSDFEALVSKTGMNRRTLLRVMGAGIASAVAVPLLSSCTGTSGSAASSTTAAATTSAGTTSAAATSAATSAAASSASSAAGSTASSAAGSIAQLGGTVAFGSNASDETPKKAYQAVFDAFNKLSGTEVKVNTVDHNSFQENINNYLQGSPDEVFTWFAGNRMQFFAAQGLLTPIDDVWSGFQDQYSDGFIQASTAADGKKYFVPFYNYPWAFFYRKSVFADKGYTVPKTLDELKTLATKMKADGLVPIAFADKDGWPAMGTFDYLDMRINGYQFHMDLMAHKESWTDPKVKKVFDTWKELLPLHQEGSLGRTWQEAAQSLVKKEAGLYLLGMFVGQQFPAADADDLDFFAFPEIDSAVGHGRGRSSDRRVPGEQQGPDGSGQGPAHLPGVPGGAGNLSRQRPEQRRRQQDRGYQQVHRPAEEGRRVDRIGEEHLPVPGPGHPPRLRQPGRHPGPAAVHQGHRHRRGDLEPGGTGKDDLHLVTGPDTVEICDR